MKTQKGGIRNLIFSNKEHLCSEFEFVFDLLSFSLFINIVFKFFFLEEIYFEEFGISIRYRNLQFIYYTVFILNLILFYFFSERMRTYRNIITLGITPAVFISILRYMSMQYEIVFFIAILIIFYVIYNSLLVLHKFLNNVKRRKWKKWIYLAGKNIRQVINVLGLILFLMFISTKILEYRNTGNIVSSVETINNVEGDLWENNKNILILLKEENYTELSIEEKVAALQGIVDLETVYYGIEAVMLRVEALKEEDLNGYYDSDNRVITVNKNVLDLAADTVIEVVLHECYHAYQHACIGAVDWDNVNLNIRLYKDILQWKEEFDTYIDISTTSNTEEYAEYYNQSCEQDAREYAREWSYWYMLFINNIETKDVNL